MIYTIKSGRLTAKINSLGAELISVVANSEEYIWQGGVWNQHAPVLFPVCGRILNGKYTYAGKEYMMGLHGFASASDFALVSIDESRVVLEFSSTQKTLESYPFEFVLRADFSVEGNTLRADFTVENHDSKVMPHMFGWHPAFTLWGEYPIESFTLDFGDTEYLTQHFMTDTKFVSGAIASFPLNGGKYTLSEEEIYSQDTLIFSDTPGAVTLGVAGCGRSLELTWSDNLPYLAVWKWPLSSARYICLEPWCGIPGDGVTPEALENKVVRNLAPGGSEVYRYTVKCK